MNKSLECGDIVSVRTGGPEMAVIRIDEGGKGGQTVWCVWFEGSERKTAAFPRATLRYLDMKEP